ncbi:unnamed protein product [Fraxinus pennsylvanica]|uniref:Prolamin-like domain-containing protein n=1 Tax=Fraxinus pennsylvanica TaxID=56036 RepID=A0AAD2DPG5_9LAMI|nr:unnamed protein product [Fraxinus pennsylvanica]
MAFEVVTLKGVFAFFMVVCMATSAVPSSMHVAATPHPQFSTVGAPSDSVLMEEGFLPCLEALIGIEGCEEIFKAVFGLPVDASCCQVVNQIAKICLPKEPLLNHTFLPVALDNCITVPAPPASI